MNRKEPYQPAFPLEGIEAALRRAAIKARERADRLNTPFYIMMDGKVVDLRQLESEAPSSR